MTRASLREIGLVYAAVCAATAAITYAPRLLPGMGGYEHLLIGGLFLFAAVQLARREPNGMRRFGIDLAGVLEPPDVDDERPAGPLGIYDLARALIAALPLALKESAVAIGVALLIFPPFVVGFQLYYRPSMPFHAVVPDELGAFIATQLVVVALPEEAFFRGFVQTRASDGSARGRGWFEVGGVAFPVYAIVLQAALFAVIHYISIPNPARLAVFFPGLLFGVLRTWRGGIGAAILLHAMSNVLAELLERGRLS
ncbi:MAG: myxosortase MrtC [Sandaracinaceae bacterium]